MVPFDQSVTSQLRRPTREQAEAAVRTLICWAGDNVAREGLRDTPARVVNAFDEICIGYRTDPVVLLERTFQETHGYDEMVVLRDIRLTSRCEHLLTPIVGKAHVGYLPQNRVVGISKLARLVDVYAKRLQLQERMTAQIAGAIEHVLRPRGVAVIIEASHHCMTARGVGKPHALVTSRMLGKFRKCHLARRAFLQAIATPQTASR